MNEHISEQVDDVKGYVYVGVWMDVHMGFPDGAMLCLVTQLCPTFCDPMDCSLPGSSVLGDSPGKNTGLGCHALLQGIFLTQAGIKPVSLKSPASAGGLFTTGTSWEAPLETQ